MHLRVSMAGSLSSEALKMPQALSREDVQLDWCTRLHVTVTVTTEKDILEQKQGPLIVQFVLDYKWLDK